MDQGPSGKLIGRRVFKKRIFFMDFFCGGGGVQCRIYKSSTVIRIVS